MMTLRETHTSQLGSEAVVVSDRGDGAEIIAAAKRRINEMVPLAIARLEEIIKNPESEASSVRAAQDALARAGLRQGTRGAQR